MNEIGFAKKTIEQTKLKELYKSDEGKKIISEGLMMLFVRIPNLLGIKEEISDINKIDIKEMILSHFKTLSLIEIDYAFKLERYGLYENKTEHFQLFNAEYVSSILNKYKKWLQKTRMDNNLPMTTKQEEKKEMSEEDKQTLIFIGIIDCFETYKFKNRIDPGKSYVYDFFYKNKMLPEHTKEFRKRVNEQAIEEIEENPEYVSNNPVEAVKIIKEIKSGKRNVKVKCKEIVLKEFFNKVIEEGKTIEDYLK